MLRRREILTGALATAGAALTAPGSAAISGPRLGPATAFSFNDLKARAATLAAAPYRPPVIADPGVMQSIDYDAYGQIRYRPEMTLWNDMPGAQPVRLFAPGRYFKEPVDIHVVQGGQARQVLFSLDLFDMPKDSPLRQLKGGGFAGFRLMWPGKASDWLAYLGASYFRASGPFDQYGASARGLAINAGGPATEEFPRFTSFWLEQDGQGGLIAYALLDSPSVAGAYRMACRQTPQGPVQDIEAQLHMRAAVETLGVAPLTSMFWYGENDAGGRRDWRPEVHDSDGLALWTGAGERIWRPLANPPRVTTNAFADAGPRGFGLVQRDRSFDHYQDDGVFYEKRPSLWVEPAGDWAKGEVRLVELPTADETQDNIVAFWTPAQKTAPGQMIAARYRLNWLAEPPQASTDARVVATRIGIAGRPGQPPIPGARKYVVDFEGPSLAGLTRESDVRPVITTSRGKITAAATYPVVGTGQWRIMFDLSGLDGQPAELRAYLAHGADALSETWLYQAFP